MRSIDFQQRCQDNTMGKGLSFQQMVLIQLDNIVPQKMNFNTFFPSYIKILNES